MRSVIATQMMMMAAGPVSLGPIGSMMTDFWNLNEAANTIRYDSIIANASDMNISPIGALGTAVGPKGGSDVAANFTGTAGLVSARGYLSGQNLDVTNTSAPSHCMFGWYYSDNNTGNRFIASRWNNGGSTSLSYALSMQGSIMYIDEGSSTYYETTINPAPAVSTWHFVVFWRDAADGLVRLQVDNGTVHVSPSASNPVTLNQQVFFGQSSGTYFFLGRMSRWGWIKGNILTSAQRTSLYNGGPSGALSWADIVAAHL